LDWINRNQESRVINKVYLAVCGIGISLILSSLFFIPPAHAARLFFETEVTKVGVGQQMEIFVRLDTEGEMINALEGKVHVPSFLSVKSVRDGNSFIAFWSERPQIGDNNNIVFSGIIPGGWQGRNGMIFSFIAQTNKLGSDALTISDARVLLHDGEGTEVVTQTDLLTLHVDEKITMEELVFEEDDQEPPELFTPFLTEDPDIFEGDYILIFATQDKGSGIDRYEVRETRKRLPAPPSAYGLGKDEEAEEWKIVESPYVIMDQTLESFIYIRVIDRAGNIRVVLVEPEKPTPSRVFVVLLGVLLLFGTIIFLFVFWKRIREHT